MTKKEKLFVKQLLRHNQYSCEASKPEEYDGRSCRGMPESVWPLDKWCRGCTADAIREMIS